MQFLYFTEKTVLPESPLIRLKQKSSLKIIILYLVIKVKKKVSQRKSEIITSKLNL